MGIFSKVFGRNRSISEGHVSDETLAPDQFADSYNKRRGSALPVLDRPAELGDLVTDVVTGFHGVVVQYGLHLHGCNRLSVESNKLDEGKPQKAYTFDIQRLTVHGSVVMPTPAPIGSLEFDVGDKVKDNVNGYEGILSSIETTIGGDVYFFVDSGKLDKGKPTDQAFIPYGRAILLEKQKPPVAAGAKDIAQPGGPVTEAPNLHNY